MWRQTRQNWSKWNTKNCLRWSIRLRRSQPDAPVIREDIRDKQTGAHGARRHPNHIFTWNIGDKDKTDRVFEHADVTVKQEMLYPRVHPCPLETCGCVASFDKVRGDLTVYITSQAPHVVRTVVGLLSGDTGVENPHHFAGYRRRLRQ